MERSFVVGRCKIYPRICHLLYRAFKEFKLWFSFYSFPLSAALTTIFVLRVTSVRHSCLGHWRQYVVLPILLFMSQGCDVHSSCAFHLNRVVCTVVCSGKRMSEDLPLTLTRTWTAIIMVPNYSFPLFAALTITLLSMVMLISHPHLGLRDRPAVLSTIMFMCRRPGVGLSV